MIKNLDQFIQRVNQSKKENAFDLSSDEDLSLAIMNLISIEEHFFFTQQKTGQDKYLDLLKQVRQLRKELLKKLIKDYEGEVWCISKHLLAASMRLMEVGTKSLTANKKQEAKKLFQKAYDLYSLFWGVNLGAIDAKNIQAIEQNALNKDDQSQSPLLSKLRGLVQKIIDCCIE